MKRKRHAWTLFLPGLLAGAALLSAAEFPQARIANGQIVAVPTALAIASMQGINKIVQVLISNSIPLAGISFLTKFGFTALVDCKNRTVELES